MPPNLLFLFLSFVQANFKCNNNITLYIKPELWNGQEMFCIPAITVLFTKPDLRFRISWLVMQFEKNTFVFFEKNCFL